MWRRFSTAASEGGDIDTIWVQVTNPAQSLPNTKALFEPSRSIPGKFLIVSDVYPTATARSPSPSNSTTPDSIAAVWADGDFPSLMPGPSAVNANVAA